MIKYCSYFITLCLLFPSWASAWDDIHTHPAITEEAVDNVKVFDDFLITQLDIKNINTERLSNGKDAKTITQWLQTGSTEEDKPMCRAANHFHNP